jgi:hypothetical protein
MPDLSAQNYISGGRGVPKPSLKRVNGWMRKARLRETMLEIEENS